ncbi:myosin light chain kinase, smooth muscle-like [Saccoglossus kowalevskii]
MVKPGEIGPTFVQKPYINQSSDGRVLTFACKIAGNPKPSITWYRGNDEIRDGGRYFMDVLPEGNAYVVSLEIDSVTPSDGGNYKIVAKNQFGQTSGNIALNFGQDPADTGGDQVEGSAPRFTMKPLMKQSDDGKKLTIQCELEADPRPQITWTCNGKELFDGGKFKILTDADEEFYFLSLEITDVSDADGGDYVVFAKNALGESTSKIKLNFARADGAPTFTSEPQMKQSKDGRILTFECEIKSELEPDIKWYKGAKEIKDGGRYLIDVEADDEFYFAALEVENITPDDAGEYKVVAKNKKGQSERTINLNFDSEPEKPQKKGKAPQFASKPLMRQSKDGHQLVFETTLTADPQPQITWYCDSKVIKDGGRYHIITKKESADQYYVSLEITDVTPDDQATYKAVAVNDLGENSSTINLNFNIKKEDVQGAPSFPERPSIRQEDGGKILIIEQRMLAEPKPTVVWKHNGSVLRDSGRFRLSLLPQGKVFILQLVVSDFTPPDGGIYTIQAKNEKGEANSTITVNVDVQQAEIQQREKPEEALPIQIDFGDMADLTITKDGDMKIDLSSSLIEPSKNGEVKTHRKQSVTTIQIGPDGTKQVKKETEESISVSSTAVEGTEKTEKPTFLEKLKNLTVKDGGEVLFRVRISGTPQPTVTWLRAGKPLKSSIDFIMKQVNDVYTLNIVEVFPEDSGTYSCKAVNSAGEVISKAELEVIEPPPEPKKKKPIEEEPKLGKKETPAQESAPPPKEEPKQKKPIEEEPMLAKEVTPAQESAPPPKEEPKQKKPIEEEPMLAKEVTPAQESAPPAEAKPKGVPKTLEEKKAEAAAKIQAGFRGFKFRKKKKAFSISQVCSYAIL